MLNFNEDDHGPLQGVRVLDMTRLIAGNMLSLQLADFGAEVIKIERPEGDFARGYDASAAGQSSYFVWLNRGKTSVTIDIATTEGKAELELLIGDADVLIQNLKRGALERLGFGAKRLAKDYPRLINCAITGYGEDGPMADRKAYDPGQAGFWRANGFDQALHQLTYVAMAGIWAWWYHPSL